MEGIKNIAIIYGGSSAEREVSIESGEGIFNGLSRMGISSTLIEFADFENWDWDNIGRTQKKEDWMLVERRGACAFYARKPSFPPLSFANPITSS